MASQIGPTSYRRLLADISVLYEGARRALVDAYWKIGQRIVEVEQQGAVKAAYGAGLLSKLSQDLTRELGSGFSERQLREMRHFYLEHRIRPPAAELGWTQHVELLKIADPKKRKMLEQKVILEGLKRDELREIVQHERVREEVAANLANPKETGSFTSETRSQKGEELLTPVRGRLYAYRIIQPPLEGAGASELLIDLGFSCSKDLEDVTSRGLKVGDIVTSAKNSHGNYSLRLQTAVPILIDRSKAEIGAVPTTVNQKKLKVGTVPILIDRSKAEIGAVPTTVNQKKLKVGTDKRPQDSAVSLQSPVSSLSLYTYKASVERVVDGDTLRVVVDLGFGFKTRQYLRLRGLDCPENHTPEGKKATDFVRGRIKTADQIILASSKSDKYDRYLADVFFVDANASEQFLNNLLLQEGFAVRMEE